ncbi:MAG: hypothetical protein AB9897_07180 [Anaerolineaceae bacterium]
MENRETPRFFQKEVFYYCLFFVLALTLRFLQLGALSLGDLEANNALQAYQISRSGLVTVGGQPGYVIFTSILFFIFGNNEFWARFFPALFGAGLVLTPILYKKWLGEKGALILAFFFVLVPGFVALSRTATGTIIGVVSLVAAVGFLLNQRSILAGIFAGIALLGGTAIWPGLFGLLISFGLFRLTQIGSKKENSSEDELTPSKINWKTFGICIIGTLIIFGTTFMLQPKTISGLGTSIVNYFQSWGKDGAGASIKVLLISLFIDQFFVILFAFWGAISGDQKSRSPKIFLGIWSIISLLFTLLNPSRQVVDLVWVLLPLYTLAGIGLVDLFKFFTKGEWLVKLFQMIATISLIIFSILNLLGTVTGSSAFSSDTNKSILGILLPLALLIVVTLLVGWGWSATGARQGLFLGVGLLLLMVSFGSTWKAAGLGPRPVAELWRSDPLPVGKDLLQKSVQELSLWNTGQKNGIEVIVVAQNHPSLQWIFRDFPNAKQNDLLANSETPALIISEIDYSLDNTQVYRGQSLLWTTTVDFEQMSAKEWVTWYDFRQGPVLSKELLLWARNDLFKGS